MKFLPSVAVVCVLSAASFAAGCKDNPPPQKAANPPQEVKNIPAPATAPAPVQIQQSKPAPATAPAPAPAVSRDPRQRARDLNKQINDRHQEALREFGL